MYEIVRQMAVGSPLDQDNWRTKQWVYVVLVVKRLQSLRDLSTI